MPFSASTANGKQDKNGKIHPYLKRERQQSEDHASRRADQDDGLYHAAPGDFSIHISFSRKIVGNNILFQRIPPRII